MPRLLQAEVREAVRQELSPESIQSARSGYDERLVDSGTEDPHRVDYIVMPKLQEQ